MQIVIDIPESILNTIQADEMISREQLAVLQMHILNGTPLPQPFDLEGLKSDLKALNCGFPYGLDYLLDCLNRRLGITIIEADKEKKDV